MTQTVAKWGNSLGLRIPRAIAEQAHIEEGTKVNFEVSGGVIVVKPQRKKYSLDELLEGMGPEKVHGEIDLGEPVGNEIW